MNIETVSQRFRYVQCFVREIFEEMLYSKLQGYVWWCHLCPSEGHKYGGWELAKTRHRVFYEEPVLVF